MATLYINGRACRVAGGENLLQTLLERGAAVPYFCWHPALGAIGACRQCAVRVYRDDDDTQGKILMACMTQVADGQRVETEDEQAHAFRAAVIEWLMLHHPHDCPICDEGGECHLQDMTVMTGHAVRRTRFAKRTYRDQDLGPLIHHEMNRCIHCFRCVRFYRDYAGGDDLAPFASRNRVWFGRHVPGKLESPFSGNLVEVCPTGVFTDKSLKAHYSRKWDLQTAPGVCVHCSLGCNVLAGERYGLLRRVLARYHGAVNGHFICDRGRYGYGFVNHEQRIRRPLLRDGADQQPAAASGARDRAATLLGDGHGWVGIGSPRAGLEANFALQQLVGPERFCNGMEPQQARVTALALELLRRGPAEAVSLRRIEDCDAVLVLGEDLVYTAPMAALALRQSVRQQPYRDVDRAGLPRWDDAASRLVIGERRGPLYVAGPRAGWTDGLAREWLRAAPDDIARLGLAVAAKLADDRNAPADLPADEAELAARIAADLGAAERPLVIAGTSLGSAAVLRAAAAVAGAACRPDRPAGLFLVLAECNSAGVSLLEPAGLERAQRLVDRGAAGLVVLENDLFRRLPPAAARGLLERAGSVIALDHSSSPTTAAADVVLPAATFVEESRTLVNNEGRAQRSFQVFAPGDDTRTAWRWLAGLGPAADRAGLDRLDHLDAVLAALAAARPELAAVAAAAPGAGFRLAGQGVGRLARRATGRTAQQAHIRVAEPAPEPDPDAPLVFSMEGHPGPLPPALLARQWAPGWNSAQAALFAQQPIGGALRSGDPGVRLFEPGSAATAAGPPLEPEAAPEPFQRRSGALLVVPLAALFGTEELGSRSTWLAELAPVPRLFIHPHDADGFGLVSGTEVELRFAGGPWRLAVELDASLPVGVAAAHQGLPGQPAHPLPAWAEVEAR